MTQALACPLCGSKACCPDMPRLLDELRIKVQTLEGELTKKLMRIKALERDMDADLRNSKHYEAAKEVLEFWGSECHPNARELLGRTRLKPVLARLTAGYNAEQLKDSIRGYAAFPYVVDGRRMAQGSPGRRFIDAELIFRDPKHVDQGLALLAEARRREERLPAAPPPADSEAQLSAIGMSAVRLAEFGFHVFPIAPMAKVPATEHGLLDATREVERIIRFWIANPDYNVGIRCGIESELVVLDIDGEEGYASLRELERQFETMPTTACVVTPRGGSHYYFRHPGSGEVRNTTGFPLPGLDVRGDGGYVLGPPSLGPTGRRYEVDEQAEIADMPDWLLKLLVERQMARQTVGRDFAKLVREGAQKGERNDDLTSLAGHLWSHGHEPDEVFELVMGINEARCKPSLAAKEVKKIVESVARMRAREALKGKDVS